MIALGPRTVVVAGDDAGPPARVLAERARWPLLAEPTSGSRTGDAAIRTYRLLLGGPLADEVERVVVFGHPTLSRPVHAADAARRRRGARPCRRRARGASGRSRSTGTSTIAPTVEAADESDWFDRWKAADAEPAGRSTGCCATRPS